MQYQPVIGLEIHAALKTKTKMFCDSLNDPDEKRPNWNVCPVCMGHPGVIPVTNMEAVNKVIHTGLALNCAIARDTFFERKNYFYPDLPKGYQISQYQKPLCENGYLDIKNSKRIRITRIHLEEDAGRLYHESGSTPALGRAEARPGNQEASYSLVDYNRASTPLMELVTEPDFETGQEVRDFATELQLILRYLGVSDADMEKGLLRVEVNISLATYKDGLNQSERLIGRTSPLDGLVLGTKVEIKNLNSISAAAASVDYEIKRQTEILEKEEKVVQETRGWDDSKKATVSQRSKEEAHDYRYFPEPDLPPLKIQESRIKNQESNGQLFLDEIRAGIPELPSQRRERFQKQYGLPDADVQVFAMNKPLGDFYEHVASELGEEPKLCKLAANYAITEYQKHLAPLGVDAEHTKITPESFAELVKLIVDKTISSSAAQTVIEEMFKTGMSPEDVIKEKDLGQVSDTGALDVIVDAVIAANQKAVEDYKKGKEVSLKFLVGMAMRESKGKGNPQLLEEIIKNKLK